MKVGIVGSRRFQNGLKIKRVISEMKKKDNDLVIVSGGQPEGADGFAKKHALALEVDYVEFPPRHYNWNRHCIKEAYEYGKPYRVWNYHDRNTEIAEYSDIVLCFMPPGMDIEESTGTYDTYKKAKKLGKVVKVIN